MNKTFFLTFVLVAFAALAVTVSAAPLTVVSGTITYANSSVVDGANVDVTCQHLGINTTKSVTSGADGKYYTFWPVLNCDAGDTVWVTADKGGAEGSNSGAISFSRECLINTAIIDVQIPEFGVIAGGVALIGAVAGLTIIRRKDDNKNNKKN